jgi:hypothetical protein
MRLEDANSLPVRKRTDDALNGRFRRMENGWGRAAPGGPPKRVPGAASSTRRAHLCSEVIGRISVSNLHRTSASGSSRTRRGSRRILASGYTVLPSVPR